MADFQEGRVPNFECTVTFGGDVEYDIEAMNLGRAESRAKAATRRKLRGGSLKSGYMEPLEVECEPK